MRKTLLLSSLLLCALYVAAQTSPSQSPSSTTSQTTTSDHQTKVRGCLSGSGGNYTLTDKSGTTYQLSGDTSKLSEHVGHTVEITGTKGSPSTGSSASTSGAAGSKTPETLDVTSVKHISPNCSSNESSKY
jgi:hypothetical protein